MSKSELVVVDDDEEADEVLRERGREGRAWWWIRWEGVGQRLPAEGEGVEGGEEDGVEVVELRPRAARLGLVAGLGKLLSEE